MGLNFTTSASDRVDHGTMGSLQTPDTGTIICVARPAQVGGSNAPSFLSKRAFDTGFTLLQPGADNTEARFVITRATTALVLHSATGLLSANVWQWLAVSWDLSGVDGDQHMYHADLGSLLSEVSYDTQQAGSGTKDDNSAEEFLAGEFATDTPTTGRFDGDIARIMFFSTQLSLGEILRQQYRPVPTSSSLLWAEYGYNGTGTQPDYSGNSNNGTVTGATLADHVPVRHLRRRSGLVVPTVTAAAGATVPIFHHHYQALRAA